MKIPTQTEFEAGIPCHYVRFHSPVPPGVNKDPVSEFKLEVVGDSVRGKSYVVDAIVFTSNGVVYSAYGETNIVPLANVIYTRTIGEK